MHRLDAAHLYRLALEKGSAGARYHGIADEGVPFRDIAEVIGRRLNVPVASKPPRKLLTILAGSSDSLEWTAPPTASEHRNS